MLILKLFRQMYEVVVFLVANPMEKKKEGEATLKQHWTVGISRLLVISTLHIYALSIVGHILRENKYRFFCEQTTDVVDLPAILQ